MSMGRPKTAVERRRSPRLTMKITASVRSATGARNESLVPAARPAAAPAKIERAGADRATRPARAARPLTRRAPHAKSRTTPADVVQRLARLEVDHRLGAEHDRRAEERLRRRRRTACPIAQPDEEPERKEPEVEKRREEVAAKARIGIAWRTSEFAG